MTGVEVRIIVVQRNTADIDGGEFPGMAVDRWPLDGAGNEELGIRIGGRACRRVNAVSKTHIDIGAGRWYTEAIVLVALSGYGACDFSVLLYFIVRMV